MNLPGSNTVAVGNLNCATSTSTTLQSQSVTVGICGICAGAVQVPSIWCCSTAPTPTCAKCGATERPKPACLPILTMDPARTPDTPNTLLVSSNLKVLDLIAEGPIC